MRECVQAQPAVAVAEREDSGRFFAAASSAGSSFLHKTSLRLRASVWNIPLSFSFSSVQTGGVVHHYPV